MTLTGTLRKAFATTLAAAVLVGTLAGCSTLGLAPGVPSLGAITARTRPPGLALELATPPLVFWPSTV